MRHVYECPIRRADLHPGGTVNNVAFLDYLQEARLDLLRHHDTSVSARPGEGLVVVRTAIEYLAPLTLADRPLYVATWVTEVRAASFTMGYELYTEPDGPGSPRVHGRARTLLTPYDFEADRPRRLTPEEHERLSRGPEPAPVDERDRTSKPPGWGPGGRLTPVHVRFSDIDLLGHVNNVRYLDYVHEASVDLMLECFREAAVNGDISMVIARTDLDYVGQLNLRPEPYDVWTRVAEVGSTSVTFEAEIRDGDRVMARSRVVEVSVDGDDRPLPLIDEHRAVFERRREAALSD